MHVWMMYRVGTPSDDMAYLLGHLMAIFDQVTVSRFGQRDDRVSGEPPSGFDLVAHAGPTSRPFLDHLEAIAHEHGAAMFNPAAASWRSMDKRCYPIDYPDLIPRTLTVSSMAELCTAWEELGGAVVMKGPFGIQGQEVERALCSADLSHADRLFRASPDGDIVVQEYCPGFAKGDKRIMVSRSPKGGREIIGQFRRIPSLGGWKSNLNTGGHVERCELTHEEIRLAHHVAEISGLDYVSVDIGEHEGRNLLIETNHQVAGLIDFDMDQNARSIAALGRFLIHLARHGRGELPED